MKKTFEFGKIDFYEIGRKINAVSVVVELRKRGGDPTFTIENGERVPTGEKTREYLEFAASGSVWNARHTEIVAGGQCLDEIAKYVKDPVFKEIHRLWKLYHLNGMHAGTPEQEAAIDEWEASGNRYDYKEVCEYLKEKGLYEVEHEGKPYRYGSAWLVWEIPEEDIKKIRELLGEEA